MGDDISRLGLHEDIWVILIGILDDEWRCMKIMTTQHSLKCTIFVTPDMGIFSDGRVDKYLVILYQKKKQ